MDTQMDRHILGLSGGKDSAALAIYMSQHHPELNIEYFFTDTGHELPEVYQFLDKLESSLNINIARLKPEIGEYVEKRNEAHGEDSSKQTTSFKYWHKQNNYFLPSINARWCTINMKIKPFEKWIADSIKSGATVTSYVAIRADENREGYKPTNENIKVRFPFAEDGIDKQGVINLLEKSGVGLPDYYKWRSRSGCTFCFYQQKIEWVWLYEQHPELYKKAMKYEKDGYTWAQKESLEDIIKPERVKAIKEEYIKRMERNSNKNSPYLKDILSDSDSAFPCLSSAMSQ